MKPHLEFFPVDMEDGWQTPPGYKPGFTQRILASDLDARATKAAAVRACCGSLPESIRKSPSCTITGKRFSSLRRPDRRQ